MESSAAPLARPPRTRKVRLAYTTALCAALPLALLDGSMAALLVFSLLERVFAAVLRRAESRGAAGRALASPAAGVLTPVLVIAAWGGLVGADVLDPGSREAVSLAATALAILAIQGGLAWL